MGGNSKSREKIIGILQILYIFAPCVPASLTISLALYDG